MTETVVMGQAGGTNDLYARDLWYVIALSASLKRGQMRREMLLGEPVLLGRGNDGAVFTMRDICPHRGVPLSAGKILNDGAVQCPYHGWEFANDGVCRLIPSQVPGQSLDCTKIRVRAWPVKEQDGLIWVYAAHKPGEAPKTQPPKVDVPGSSGQASEAMLSGRATQNNAKSSGQASEAKPSGRATQNNTKSSGQASEAMLSGRATQNNAKSSGQASEAKPSGRATQNNARIRWHETQRFRCSIDHAVIGLMDPAHAAYVHDHWWWKSKPRLKEKRYAPLPLGFVMTANKPSKPAYALLGDVTTEITFELPSTRFETLQGHLWGCAFKVVGLTVCTPRDAENTDIIQVFYFPWWLSFILPLFWILGPTFIADDRKIVELQREGLRFNPNLMLIQDSDQPAIWYHRVKKAWAESTENGTEFINPVRERVLRWKS